MNAGMGHLAINPTSPYASQNASHTSLVSNLQQQRGIPDSRVNGYSAHSPLLPRSGMHSSRGPRVAPVINPNPRSVSGMPDPTAANPTKGFPWAFPDPPESQENNRRSSSDSSEEVRPSRQNSFATSVNSSIYNHDQLPVGQMRFSDGMFSLISAPTNLIDMPQTHHHSIQHRSISNLQGVDEKAAAAGNYSRTPELRISHKMAERKRRSEMKTLFDELNTILPSTTGGKSSKWETLTRCMFLFAYLLC
jgi:Helix-loop-helix DNA-binding domain